MNKNRVNELIDEIEERITLPKKEIAVSTKTTRSAQKVRINPKSKARGRGSTQPIQELVDRGFFDKEAKSDLEVVEILRKKAKPFPRNDVSVTLIRFVKKVGFIHN